MKNLRQVINEAEQSKLQKDYETFFKKTLDKYDAKSPADLSDDEKKKFFDEVKAGWTEGKGEKGSTNESKKVEEDDEVEVEVEIKKGDGDEEEEEEEEEEAKIKKDGETAKEENEANEEDEMNEGISGKDIAKKLSAIKSKEGFAYLQGFADKVAAMKSISKEELNDLLPDWVPGKDIESVFK
jgi:hypothetical protein